ncbi:hypothetical protein [Microcystis phage Me-ZS1]|nr:hypothetical protein [Microcystis phage Me-ZS1]
MFQKFAFEEMLEKVATKRALLDLCSAYPEACIVAVTFKLSPVSAKFGEERPWVRTEGRYFGEDRALVEHARRVTLTETTPASAKVYDYWSTFKCEPGDYVFVPNTDKQNTSFNLARVVSVRPLSETSIVLSKLGEHKPKMLAGKAAQGVVDLATAFTEAVRTNTEAFQQRLFSEALNQLEQKLDAPNALDLLVKP